jgi:hypothetical protein
MTFEEVCELRKKFNLTASIGLNSDGSCELFVHQEGLDPNRNGILNAVDQALEIARYHQRKNGDGGVAKKPKPLLLP